MPDISELLKKHEHRFATQEAYAQALGVNVGRLNRLLNRKGPYALNAVNCLKLAEITGESPSVVLKAAGKHDLAVLIESLYGAERKHTTQEREIVRHMRAMEDADRVTVLGIARRLAQLRSPGEDSAPPRETGESDPPEPGASPPRGSGTGGRHRGHAR